MAYNADSAYQPPQRSYYGQAQQQQAPVHQQTYEPQASERFGQASYDQGYDQGYGQDYGGQQQPTHAQSNGYSQQQESFSDGYHGGYQRQKPRPISGGTLAQQRQPPAPQQQQQPQQYERNYDPRYQQRSGRATPQGQPAPRPQQQQQQQYAQASAQPSQGYQQQQQAPQQVPRDRQAQPASHTRPAIDPRTAYPQPSPQHRQHQQQHPPPEDHRQQQQQQRQPPLPRPTAAAPQKPTPAPPSKPSPPKKQTMQEWKAAEKARLHKDAASPSFMPQDNAFPTFPNSKPPKKEQLHPDERSGTEMSRRSGESGREEQRGRDFVSSGGGGRPEMPRGNSAYRNDAQQQQQQGQGLGRPSVEHKPYSFEPVPETQEEPLQQQRPVYDRQASSGQRVPQQQTYPLADERETQRPSYDRQVSSGQRVPQQRAVENGALPREEQRSPAQTRGYGQSPPPAPYAQGYSQPLPNSAPPRQDPPQAIEYQQSPLPAPQDRYAQGYTQPSQPKPHIPPQQARRGTADGARPPVPAIDTTAQARRAPPSAYMDHQPLSPAHIPPRPSTAQSQARSPSSKLQITGPGSPYGSALSYEMTPTVYKGGSGEAMAPQQQQQQRSDHGDETLLGDVYDGYREEREPQSAGAVRSAREIESEMPDFDSAAPGGTSLLHKRGQHQAQDQRVEPQQQRVAPAAVGGAFEFGVPAPQQQQQPAVGRGYYEPEYGQEGNGYGHPAVQPLPPQPPFASEPVARKSMDDARQMSYRQGPPPPQPLQGVRFTPNGQPPRGQYPPQQRPGMDERNPSSQTVQSMNGQPPRGAAAYMPQQRPGMEGRNVPGQTMQSVRSNGSQPPRGAALPPPQRPSVDDRNMSGRTMQTWGADPSQRVPSAPPLRQGFQEPPGRPPNGVPLSQQRSAPEYDQQRHSNPDALPYHPVPVRPGLMEDGVAQQLSKPPPVRQYDTASLPPHARQASTDRPAQPVTPQELDHLRAAVTANPNNPKQALLLAKKLVEASNILASEGGRADPKTTARNREKYVLEAYKRIKKLAAAGYPDAQFYLADCYGQGLLGLEVDTKEAFNMYQAAAKQGHPQAAYRTAVCCEMGPEEGGGTRKDYAKAVQWYRRAAALGDLPAMYKLGIILLKGLLGQPRNVSESVVWLKRAAERADRDNPHALHELGTLYEGTNTAPDVRQKLIADDAYARELFVQAAGLGYKFSQFRLGQAYEYGALGLGIDHRASIAWYSKAAAQGEHQAELALSGWYLTGAEGILAQSDTEAYLWARKAAQAEPPGGKALFAMGYFSEMGIGCPASVEEARRWYGRAAAYKFPNALERLEELKKSGKSRVAPVNGKLARKDQKRDEAECGIM
ncbi:hypothetical protein B0A55_04958 [Friedmanniomyces simplex]|uniref:Uncharacterized protein n=1 Tax=Friedmanniomyces simplex TaxID=329884 RepID=A0A4U0XS62_9PEZI|nr:hypothetical protein B0A55_04958 [Friedmanniomyces simplex]